MVDLDIMTAAALLQGMFWKRGWMDHEVKVIGPSCPFIQVSHGRLLLAMHHHLALIAAREIWKEF